ncbi:hypothetical protein LTR09_007708 [Extremus antarcticus]|uniref:ATP-dependent DNA ligase family profile domain-containing protein n=1 Tax=Extremus antarcticus TaxID=702011 RepID=A0AAJ0DIH5_9PEZI|nr:hypothetical protein LTR09_007708 [Extremus antarcticus]
MPLPFSEICTLLSRIEELELSDPPFLRAAEKATHVKMTIESWFKSHRKPINDLSVPDAVAFLSTLLPERRTDRVYGVQATSLCRILSRCLSLSAARTKDLHAYKTAGRGDLGTCVERVLAAGGPPALPHVTAVEIDDTLNELASPGRSSAQSFTNRPPASSKNKDGPLGLVFKRLAPWEAKWMVRLILKDISPVRLEEKTVLKCFHFLLPDLLLFQDDLASAIGLLQKSLSDYPASCDPRSEKLHRLSARSKLRPVVGIKVGRPNWTKARSIDHCMKKAADHEWVLERKYDGEYCEIHIDLSRSPEVSKCITIFSKSGKESTADRTGLHQTIVQCLRLGTPNCNIKRQAILLGEMVVYSDTERRILPFEKIRRHVTRSRSFIGADCDSLPKPDEHLAIVFFDILLQDDEVVMNRPIVERRRWLREIYTKIAGRAFSSEWKIVNFAEPSTARVTLGNQFAASIAERCEGLIMKPCGLPYFALEAGVNGRLQTFMKVKKDYIDGLGDEADFAVIGASYNAQQAAKCGFQNMKWTDFHLGCLTNKDDVLRFDARPRFRIVGTIQQDFCILRPVLQAANDIGQFCAKPYDSSDSSSCQFDVDRPPKSIDVLFDKPFVFEVLGSGFEKPSNCDFFMLRHARVKKLHQDRSWENCVSFAELQKQAADTRAAPVDSESQETRKWVERLTKKCRRKFERQRTKTPSTVRTTASVTSSGARSTSFKSVKATKVTVQEIDADGTTLDGIMLVATTSPKRKRPSADTLETPCPDPKRPRPSPPSKPKATPSLAREQAVRTPRPLADITNTANQCSPHTSPPKPFHPAKRPKTQTPLLNNLQRAFPARSSHSNNAPQRPHPSCSPSTCPLANSAIYLAPCIARTPYITHDLLRTHTDIIIVPSLDYWDRDVRLPSSPITSSPTAVLSLVGGGAWQPPPEVVGESQAYEGMKKIVLVESKRRQQVEEIVARLEVLQNKGCFGTGQAGEGEGVEVWDWRVWERWVGHGVDKSEEVGRGSKDRGGSRVIEVVE